MALQKKRRGVGGSWDETDLGGLWEEWWLGSGSG